MRIDVRDRGLKVGDGLRNYVGLRLMFVLDHLAGQVEAVTVRLADVDAASGGIGTRCRMLARLTSSREVHVVEADPGLYAAIDRAAERLAQGVARELLRQETSHLAAGESGQAGVTSANRKSRSPSTRRSASSPHSLE
jgi:ribosome-associated translation inhibitor RaiA